MAAFLFYFFSALTILAALFVVLNRNAVNSAMGMILALVGVAALFVLLEAYFLAVLQVVVYAGAVMVLFLFVIMLLDTEHRRRLNFTGLNIAAGLIALVLLAAGAGWLAQRYPAAAELPPIHELPAANNPMGYATAAKAFGFGLFTRYMLPFQVAGFLLLIAMVGVIVLSKRPDAPTGDPVKEPRA